MNLSSAKDILVALFITDDVQDTCSFKGAAMQGPYPRQKVPMTFLLTWKLPWNHALHPESSGGKMPFGKPACLALVLRLWAASHAPALVCNSAEHQVGFTDEPIAAYFLGKSSALESRKGSGVTAVSGAETQWKQGGKKMFAFYVSGDVSTH